MADIRLAWFRRDLRLHDNPVWAAATRGSDAVALVVIEPGLLDRAGPFRREAYLSGLRLLDADLRRIGGRLRVERGDPAVVVPRCAAEVDATSVHVGSDVTRWASARDRRTAAALEIPMTTHWSTLVHAPGTVRTKAGGLSKVFTAFHRVWESLPLPSEETADSAAVADHPGAGVPDDGADLTTDPEDLLDRFLAVVDDYPTARDLPAVAGTSALSTALRFGTISPAHLARTVGRSTAGRAAVVRQLAWRDWYAHLTSEHPDIDRVALRPEYDGIAWEHGPDADAAFAAWTAGRTGFPIVDAGMRQLAATGWMHNRVRMITASFLVKDLLIDWRRGERWFRHLLSDGDIPQNAGNWQWIAGTGPDAAPYFRIFNPTVQSRRFDPSGDYIRRWVPELAHLDDTTIHEPAGSGPHADYPPPIVDHRLARDETLLAYRTALGASRDK